MSRLAEVLVEAGVITPADRTRAEAEGASPPEVAVRLVAGGADPKTVVEAVARAGMPVARPALLQEIPPEILARIGAEIAARHLAVPLMDAGGELAMAVADPWDTAARKALAKAAGMPVRPLVCDLRDLLRALSRYYGVTPPPGILDAVAPLPVPPLPHPAADPVPESIRETDDDVEVVEPATGELADLFQTDDAEPVLELTKRKPPEPAAAGAPPAPEPPPPEPPAPEPPAPEPSPPEPSPPEPSPPEPSPPEPPPPEPSPPEPSPPEPPPPEPPPPEPPPPEPPPPEPPAALDADAVQEHFDFAVTRLRSAESRDEVADATLAFVAACLPRAALLALRGGELTPWRADPSLAPALEGLQLLAGGAGLPALVAAAGDPHFAPPPGPIEADPFLARLDPPPVWAALVPVRVGPRVACVIYGDAPAPGPPPGVPRELLIRLGSETGEALSRLILQTKLG